MMSDEAQLRRWYEEATQIEGVSSQEIESFLLLVAKSYGHDTIDGLLQNVNPTDHWANEENARQGLRAIRAACLGNYFHLGERMAMKFTTPAEEEFMARNFGFAKAPVGRPVENKLRDDWVILAIEAFRAAGLTKARAFEETEWFFNLSIDRVEKIYKTQKLPDHQATLLRQYFAGATVGEVQAAINTFLDTDPAN